MKIAVIGAGAIGGLVAAYCKAKGLAVTLVGRPAAVRAVETNGLTVSGVRGDMNVNIDVAGRLTYVPDVAVLATKTQDMAEAVKDNRKFLADTVILTTQNGVRAEELAMELLPAAPVIGSIVMFGATSLEPGRVVHNFEGSWIIGRMSGTMDPLVYGAEAVLKDVFPIVLTSDIKGMKYLKIFLNANNCLPALLGRSMQEVFLDADVSRISVEIWREGLSIVRRAGIELKSLPDYPAERLENMVGMPPAQAAAIFSKVMTGLSKEPLYGSVLQSIKRGKPSEIDYLNGEFVRLAAANGLAAPLNERLTALVHQVEETGRFLTKEELWDTSKRLFPR